ncbi:MAG: DUF5684 domain-containing protein [Lachnospiraceae bacterium]|nr:DUF5684 domain-containing protein [Lachnospiraceae bacterium]
MNSSSQMTDAAASIIGMLGITTFVVIMLIFGIVCFAMMVFIIIVNWKLMEKAGEPGWKAIIPYYNIYTFCDIAMTKPTYIVVFLACIIPLALAWFAAIPYLGVLISMIIWPFYYAACGILNFALAKAYGCDTGMCVLAIFFPPIVRAIMAFSKNIDYEGSKLSIFPES